MRQTMNCTFFVPSFKIRIASYSPYDCVYRRYEHGESDQELTSDARHGDKQNQVEKPA